MDSLHITRRDRQMETNYLQHLSGDLSRLLSQELTYQIRAVILKRLRYVLHVRDAEIVDSAVVVEGSATPVVRERVKIGEERTQELIREDVVVEVRSPRDDAVELHWLYLDSGSFEGDDKGVAPTSTLVRTLREALRQPGTSRLEMAHAPPDPRGSPSIKSILVAGGKLILVRHDGLLQSPGSLFTEPFLDALENASQQHLRTPPGLPKGAFPCFYGPITLYPGMNANGRLVIWVSGYPRVKSHLVSPEEKKSISETSCGVYVVDNGLLGANSVEIDDVDGVGVVCLAGIREISSLGNLHLVTVDY